MRIGPFWIFSWRSIYFELTPQGKHAGSAGPCFFAINLHELQTLNGRDVQQDLGQMGEV